MVRTIGRVNRTTLESRSTADNKNYGEGKLQLQLEYADSHEPKSRHALHRSAFLSARETTVNPGSDLARF